jgi:hypothetical protein
LIGRGNLRYRIFEVTETLDIGTRHVPECLCKYHYSIHASITAGQSKDPNRVAQEARMFRRDGK